MPDPTLTIRVLVVDDDPLVRELLRSYLAAFNDLEVVGMAADGLAAKEPRSTLLVPCVMLSHAAPTASSSRLWIRHALADAVRAAYGGLHVMSPSSVGYLRVPARAGRTSAQVPTFSERERLTLAALCRGESNAQIAE